MILLGLFVLGACGTGGSYYATETPALAVNRQSSPRPTVTIKNSIGMTVWYVYLSPTSSDSWGEDRLADDEVLSKGSSVTLTLNTAADSGDRYDIRLTDDEGNRYEKRNVRVSSTGVVEFTQSDFHSSDGEDHRTNTEVLLTVTLGNGYRRRFTASSKVHIYRIDVPSGTSRVTAWTEGGMDTRINVVTQAGLVALLEDKALPNGAALGSDDDSGKDLNARITITVPSGSRSICFLVDEVDTDPGEYVFRIRSGS